MSKLKIKSKEKEIKKIAAGSGYKLLSQRASKDLINKRKKYEDSPDEDDDGEKEGIFRAHTDRLKALRKSGLADEAYDIEELNSLEELILDLLPIAEENYKKFPIHTAGSAVNNFVTTLTNLQADRRALQNLSARADRVINIFDQSIEDVTKIIITSTQKLQKELAEKNSSKDNGDIFKDFLRSLGKELAGVKENNSNGVLQLMSAPKK
jgi:hypothetical protein